MSKREKRPKKQGQLTGGRNGVLKNVKNHLESQQNWQFILQSNLSTTLPTANSILVFEHLSQVRHTVHSK